MRGPELSAATGGKLVRLAVGGFYSGVWRCVASAIKDGKWLIEEMEGRPDGRRVGRFICFYPGLIL